MFLEWLIRPHCPVTSGNHGEDLLRLSVPEAGGGISRAITATHLREVDGQGSVGPKWAGKSRWVSVYVWEQVLVSCGWERSDERQP